MTRGPFQLDSVLGSFRLHSIAVVRNIPASWTYAPNATNGPRVTHLKGNTVMRYVNRIPWSLLFRLYLIIALVAAPIAVAGIMLGEIVR